MDCKKEKEWYKDVSAGYMEGNIDEIMCRARERKGLEDSNLLSVCDQCALATAIGILTGITGVENVMVIHGPTGCAQLQGSTTGTRFVTTTSREDLQKASYYVPYFICTGIEEKEVVFGGIKKLREAILYAEQRFHPKLITVLTTCPTQIIGDDVRGLAKKLQGEIKAEILDIPTSGLKRGFTGYDLTYTALIDRFVAPVTPEEKIPGSLNVIADKRRTGGEVNYAEVSRVFRKLGIQVNCRFVRNTNLEEIRGLARAQLNIMMCHNAGIPTARHLEEKFGMPYLEQDYPMGLQETVQWYRDILEQLNMQDDKGILEEEHARALPRLEKAREALQGKRMACVGAPGRMIRYLDLIHELGIEPVYLALYFHLRDIGFKMLEEKLKKYGFDPHIVIQSGHLSSERNLARFKPDLMFGDPSDSHFAFRNDIAFCHLESSPQSGFSGTLNIAERWADAVRRPVYDFWHQYTELTPYSGQKPE